MDFSTNEIRNVVIAGHGQTGKTTLLEQFLFVSGKISKAETVASGKTVSDNTVEEISRKISIYSSMASVSWKDYCINFWDTPGASDFVGEVISAFRSCETALMLVDGKSGCQIETIKLWRDLDRRNKPRMVFINHLEEERSSFETCKKDIHDKFNVEVCPVTIPMGLGDEFRGIINVLEGKAYFIDEKDGKTETESEIPAEFEDEYNQALSVLAGSAAEGDDDLLVKFIDEGELTSEEIIKGLKIAFSENKIVPVFAGSTVKNCGIKAILDFICDISPSPSLRLEMAIDKNEEKKSVKIASSDETSCLVVKTSNDQFSGKMSYIKVINGSLKPDMEIFNVNEQKKEKIGKLYKALGKKLEEVRVLNAGDIGIATKLSSVKTSDTLSVNNESLLFTRLRHPEPVYSMAVSAKEKKDEDKMNDFFIKATEEDKTLSYKYNGETKQNVLSGMGELHLSIFLEKLKAVSKIQVETSEPRVAYRETILRKAQAEYTHKKQSGGHGQYGKVVLSVEPLERGDDYQFTNAIFGGAISKGYIPGVEKGVKEAMEHGVLAGYPVVDVAVTVLDGKEHPVDSSEMAFKIASRNAFKDATRNAGPVLLEPIMNITIFVDEKYLGDIMSDISSRRGRILGQDSLGGGIQEIKAQAPKAELLKYSIDLRSMTSGTGSFETSFDHYSEISGKIAENVILQAKKFMQIQNADE